MAFNFEFTQKFINSYNKSYVYKTLGICFIKLKFIEIKSHSSRYFSVETNHEFSKLKKINELFKKILSTNFLNNEK